MLPVRNTPGLAVMAPVVHALPTAARAPEAAPEPGRPVVVRRVDRLAAPHRRESG